MTVGGVQVTQASECVHPNNMWTSSLHSDGFQPPPALSADSTMVPQPFRNGVSFIAIVTCILLGYMSYIELEIAVA
jgi:hypothetical protein